LVATRQLGVNSVALWRLGSEDPGFWTALETWRGGQGKPNLTAIIPANSVDVEDSGEILRITDTPRPGQRTVTFGPDGLIRPIAYDVLPTPYVVRRTGADRPRLVALTFDDGPDPDWTPKILSILESRNVPATFFVIGENAVANPGLLQREIAGGSEIGNHS